MTRIIATTILDSLLHHSTTLHIRGKSYRLKDLRKAGLGLLAESSRLEERTAAALNGRRSGV